MSATYDETTKTTLVVNKIPLALFENIQATADELWFVPDDDDPIVLGTIGDWLTNVRIDNPYGCVLADGGTYADSLSVDFTKNNFPDLYAKLVAGTIPSVSWSTFEDYYYRYGWCGVFGLDTTNERFRIPKVTHESQENIVPQADGSNANLGRTLIESQNPLSSNGYKWYNLYDDGWLEQGGETTMTAGAQTLSFNENFRNTDYYISMKAYDSSGTALATTFTLSSFAVGSVSVTPSAAVSSTNYVRWYCCGYAPAANGIQDRKYYIRAFNTHQEASLVDLRSDMDTYVNDTLKPSLLGYTNDTLKPSLLTYTNDTLKPALLSYNNNTLKPALDTYVNNTNKPALDTYVNNTNKPALDTYVNNTLKPTLDQYIAQKVLELTGIAVGTIVPYAGDTAPSGWFICDGRELYTVDYPALSAVCGSYYGRDDSKGTFNIPNLINKVPMHSGIGIGNSSDGSLPNIWGGLDFGDRTPINGWTPTNAFAYNGNVASKAYYSNSATQSNKNAGVNFYASRCGNCYGRYNEDRVYPSHLCMRFIIKGDI